MLEHKQIYFYVYLLSLDKINYKWILGYILQTHLQRFAQRLIKSLNQCIVNEILSNIQNITEQGILFICLFFFTSA